MKSRIGVLVSGRGSNLQAIIEAGRTERIQATVVLVVSDRADAHALSRARESGIEGLCINPGPYRDRDAYDRVIADALIERRVDLVCLAGYMRLVGAPLLEAFPNRILNVHPSLLPAFRGLHAQRQALEHGVRVTGATVHLVTSGLDDGPIVVQAPVPVVAGDTEETLSARVLLEEHRIYPEAIRLVLGGAWRLDGRRFTSTAPTGAR